MSCQCIPLPAVSRALFPSMAEAVLLTKPTPRSTARKSEKQPTSTARWKQVFRASYQNKQSTTFRRSSGHFALNVLQAPTKS